MGLLRIAAPCFAVLGAACYAPEIRDCSVQCSSVDECALDQQCGTDGFCVSAAEVRCDEPGTEGGSGSQTIVLPDAGVPVDAPPDAPTLGTLSLSVEGKGQLQVVGIEWCSSSCVVTVPLALPVTIVAVPGNDFYFDKWTSGPCAGDVTTCTFIPALAMSVGAKFRRED